MRITSSQPPDYFCNPDESENVGSKGNATHIQGRALFDGNHVDRTNYDRQLRQFANNTRQSAHNTNHSGNILHQPRLSGYHQTPSLQPHQFIIPRAHYSPPTPLSPPSLSTHYNSAPLPQQPRVSPQQTRVSPQQPTPPLQQPTSPLQQQGLSSQQSTPSRHSNNVTQPASNEQKDAEKAKPESPKIEGHGSFPSHTTPTIKGDILAAPNQYIQYHNPSDNQNTSSSPQNTQHSPSYTRTPSQDQIEAAKKLGLEISVPSSNNQNLVSVNIDTMHRPEKSNGFDGKFTDAPAVRIRDAALPDQATRVSITTPVYFISPSPLRADSPEDRYIQKKIGKEQLPDEVRGDKNKMAALNDIRSRFNSDYVMEGEINNDLSFDENRNSIESTNPLQPPVKQPAVGSYVLNKFSIGGNLTYSGQNQTLYGYAKILNSGSVTGPVGPDISNQKFDFYTRGQSFVNHTAQTMTVSPRDGESGVNTTTTSTATGNIDQHQTTWNAGISGQPSTGLSSSGSFTRTSSSTKATNQEDTQRNQSATESSRNYGPLTLQPGQGYVSIQSQTGTLATADLKDVQVSLPRQDFIKEILVKNLSIGDYIYDDQGTDGSIQNNREFYSYSDEFLKNGSRGSAKIATTGTVSSTGGNDMLVPRYDNNGTVRTSFLTINENTDDNGNKGKPA